MVNQSSLPMQTWDNQGLFSNHYLETQFPALPFWQDESLQLHQRFERLKEIYAEAQSANIFNTKDEEQTKDRFINPVLRDVLGFEYDLELRSHGRRADYGLFVSHEEYNAAKQDLSYGSAYCNHLCAIAEAKYWGRELNKRDTVDIDRADPTAQTVSYLDAIAFTSNYKVLWGILTNGKWWRLFYYRAGSVASNFYQVNVAQICEQDDFDSFIYFYGMFSVAAFVSDARNKTWFDAYLSGSATYAEEISAKLREVIFENVFEHIAQGLVSHRRSDKGISEETAESKSLLFRASLTLLYRILFVLYAESRQLLPVNDLHGYANYSLRKLCNDIWDALHSDQVLSDHSYMYWDRLKNLFNIIDRGDRALNVPRYNGGLFAFCAPGDESDPTEHTQGARFLAEHAIGDSFIAYAIQGLVFDESEPGQRKFYDYSSLDVQHLGTIYEGLLEFTVEIADTPLLAVPKNGSVVWLPEDLADADLQDKAVVRKQPGDVFIVNTKGERKSTGAYYTPQSIVEEIVRDTVQVKLREIIEEAETFWQSGGPGATNERAFTEMLYSLTVCDPAMGSGHFLVHAVDVIADEINRWHGLHPDSPLASFLDDMRNRIIDAVRKQGVSIDEDKLENRHLIRRMVLKRCIFGVDINPMAVELAKLSLWLHSFTVGAPLSFLDHHLKTGNSLIGSFNLSDVVHTETRTWDKVVEGAQFMWAIDRLNDTTIEEVTESRRKYEEAGSKIIEAIQCADVSISRYFIDELKDGHKRGQVLQCAINPKGQPRELLALFQKAEDTAQKFQFFHWKLEFPDVFITPDGSNYQPDAGFDCVIGNPPWERMKLQENEFFALRAPEIAAAPTAAKRRTLIKKLEQNNPELFREYCQPLEDVKTTMDFIRKCGQYPLLGKGDINLYSVLMERAITLTHPEGKTGFLTPSGIATDNTSKEFFQEIVEQQRLVKFIDFENKKVFFPEVDSRFKFAISIINGRNAVSESAQCAFFIHSMDELQDEERVFELTAEDFALLNPNTKTCPIFRTRKDAELTKKIYLSVPILINESQGEAGNPWGIKFFTMFHMANDSHLFKTAEELGKDGFWQSENYTYKKGNELYVRLYEGKMVQMYDHRAAHVVINDANVFRAAQQKKTTIDDHKNVSFILEGNYYVPWGNVNEKINENILWHIGFKDITAPTNERSFITAALPPVGFSNKVPLIIVNGKNPNKYKHCLLSNLSCFVFDYACRQKIGGQTLNYFIVKQFPAIPPNIYINKFQGIDLEQWISERVLKLVYTAWDMKGFADDMGYEGEPFVWDEEERLHLRCQLDALYFNLYGLTREETDYVMETFPIVKRHDIEKYGTYRTKELILQYYNAYAAGDMGAYINSNTKK